MKWRDELRPQVRVRLRSGAVATIHGKTSDGVLTGTLRESDGSHRSLRWNRDGDAHPDSFPHDDDITEAIK